jgi:plasmid stabilization system protein ParE
MEVCFHRLAAQEYRFAFDWYRQRESSVARGFRDAVDHAIVRILKDPDSHLEIVNGIRSISLQRFPYVLIFARDTPGSLMILAVAHAKRRSGYWKHRRP